MGGVRKGGEKYNQEVHFKSHTYLGGKKKRVPVPVTRKNAGQ